MINSQKLILHLPTASLNDQQLFLNQHSSDIILTLPSSSCTLYLHMNRLLPFCRYFQSKQGQKHIKLQKYFKEEKLSKIISLLYGFRIQLDRSLVGQYYKIAKFLQFNAFIDMLEKDIQQRFDEYDIFIILGLSYQFNKTKIIQLCLRGLLNEDFEQLQYNRFDLLKCDENVFKIVIAHHNKMRAQGKTKGFTWLEIQQLIKQYCQTNKLSTNKTARLLHQLVDHMQLFQQQNIKKLESKKIPEYHPTSKIIAKRYPSPKLKKLDSIGKMTQSMSNDKMILNPRNSQTHQYRKPATFYSQLVRLSQQQIASKYESQQNKPVQNEYMFANPMKTKENENNLIEHKYDDNLELDRRNTFGRPFPNSNSNSHLKPPMIRQDKQSFASSSNKKVSQNNLTPKKSPLKSKNSIVDDKLKSFKQISLVRKLSGNQRMLQNALSSEYRQSKTSRNDRSQSPPTFGNQNQNNNFVMNQNLPISSPQLQGRGMKKMIYGKKTQKTNQAETSFFKQTDDIGSKNNLKINQKKQIIKEKGQKQQIIIEIQSSPQISASTHNKSLIEIQKIENISREVFKRNNKLVDEMRVMKQVVNKKDRVYHENYRKMHQIEKDLFNLKKMFQQNDSAMDTLENRIDHLIERNNIKTYS